jgi:hypothetical protein
MTLQEIEKHVAELPPEQFVEFTEWFGEFKNQVWDQQIAADAASGKLDHLVKEARDEHAAGLTRPI